MKELLFLVYTKLLPSQSNREYNIDPPSPSTVSPPPPSLSLLTQLFLNSAHSDKTEHNTPRGTHKIFSNGNIIHIFTTMTEALN